MTSSLVRRVLRKIYPVLVRLIAATMRRFPDRVLLGIRSGTKIVRKMDFPEHDILLNIDSEIEYGIRLHSCAKEPETVEWIRAFFKEGDVFYDIGANIGAYSLVASKLFKGNIRVYAFEPAYMNFGQLCTNIALNHCQDSITPFQIALSDRTNIDILNYSSMASGGALHSVGEPVDFKGDTFLPALRQPVLSFRMDDLINQFCLPLPTHIKIDVDGTEFKILAGATETLTSPRLNTVIMEINGNSQEASKIVELFKQKGLQLGSVHKYQGADNRFATVSNYIFQREPSLRLGRSTSYSS